MTKGAYCGDTNCEVCVIVEKGSMRFSPAVKDLSQKDRDKMPASSFAFVDKNGGKHLPIHDAAHVQSALGRFKQQDFSEAKGDPDEAKAKAAQKIKAAAGKHGIDLDDKSAVAEAATKGAVGPGVPEGALQAPASNGDLNTGQSGIAGSVTAGPRPQDGDASVAIGGQSTYAIPDEAKVTNNPPIPLTTDPALTINRAGAGGLGKAAAVASLFEAMAGLDAQRQAVKDGLQIGNPTGDAAMSPGSMPWESFDSATLAQVAQCLAGCCNALDVMAQREAAEAAAGDPGDMEHSWDLEEASRALGYAMGVAARLSFSEAAESAMAEKAGRTISSANEVALRAAHDHIGAVLASGAKNKPADEADESEEQDIMATITKEELAESIASGLTTALDAREAAKAEAEKNSNPVTQGGDIAEADIKATAEADADDVTAIPDGGKVDGQYINKGDGEAVKSGEPSLADVQAQVAGITKSLGEANELLVKIAKRPRVGGPILTGQAPAAEGRVDDLAKGADDGELTKLAKAVEGATDAQTRAHASQQYSLAALRRAHEAGMP
jgi:hypothetical protein